MVRRMRSGRRGVSEIMATVLLIAITLVAGAALATFVFSQFRTISTPPIDSILPGSVQCFGVNSGSITPPGGLPKTVPAGDCAMVVQNSGVEAGLILGTGPGTTFSFDQCNGLDASSCLVPSNGYSVVALRFTGASGQQVSGYLGQTNGPVLLFNVALP